MATFMNGKKIICPFVFYAVISAGLSRYFMATMLLFIS